MWKTTWAFSGMINVKITLLWPDLFIVVHIWHKKSSYTAELSLMHTCWFMESQLTHWVTFWNNTRECSRSEMILRILEKNNLTISFLSEKNGNLKIYNNSMKTDQTLSADEDHVIWSKAPDQSLNRPRVYWSWSNTFEMHFDTPERRWLFVVWWYAHLDHYICLCLCNSIIDFDIWTWFQ